MTPHYLLDLRTATDHFPGIGRYGVNLARAMAPLLGPEEQLTLLRDPARPSPWDLSALAGERVRVVDVPLSPFSLRQQWAVPRFMRRLRADLYHSPYYLMPYRPGVPTVLTVHDLIPLRFPRQSTLQARLLFRWTTALALRAADHVIAVSEATRQDLLRFFPLPADRVSVIPEAADPAFRPCSPAEVEALRCRYGLPESFVLYVGSNKPHKNLTRLVEAWAQITEYGVRNTLIIAGPWDPRYPEPRRRAEQLGLQAIRWLGPVPEADLPALYSAADLFVFPSLYEGFGLPVLEAMACGAPVVCSNTSSLPEVAGDAALRVDPTDVRALAEAVANLLTDEVQREEMRKRGWQQAARFSWERTAAMTLDVYRSVTGLA
ncbi:MAG: glycosyltransferase family 4 protein [Thermoflexales bacterium]|nr:glycosyltransferase family 4 protein [Thermoflexales bacterium]